HLVVRVSRVHSIWLDTGSATVQYVPPIVNPQASDQPDGTAIILAYRGATQVSNGALTTDSNSLDPYGELKTPPGGSQPSFFNNDSTWKTSLTQLNGARLFQMRITFVSNTESAVSPELSALGFAYRL